MEWMPRTTGAHWRPERRKLGRGHAILAAVIAISLPTGVRMNQLIAHWSIENPPDDWARIRARWIRFHILRTLFSVPGLACYLLSCLLEGPLNRPI